MQEGNLPAFSAAARRFIYQADIACAQLSKDRFQIFDFQTNMVNAFAALGNESANRRISICRLKQLQLTVANREHRNLDGLIFHCLPTTALKTKRAAVKLQGFVNRADGNADVVEFHDHRASLVKRKA
jgi:hypothetical protein